MCTRFQTWGLIAALLLTVVGVADAETVAQTLETPEFGQLTIQRTTDEPKGIVLFAPGPGGWNADLTTIVREIADQN